MIPKRMKTSQKSPLTRMQTSDGEPSWKEDCVLFSAIVSFLIVFFSNMQFGGSGSAELGDEEFGASVVLEAIHYQKEKETEE